MNLLRTAVGMARDAGYGIGNVDVTVVCESPRIAGIADPIRASLAGALDVDAGAVSVKGKTNEGMGWEGKGEGMAVHAVALLVPLAAPS